jgi:hypothetical protein
MNHELIPLETWIERRYAVRPPSIQTVRKWVRQGKIYPAPKKEGRAYYIRPDAGYVEGNADLVSRLSDSKAS